MTSLWSGSRTCSAASRSEPPHRPAPPGRPCPKRRRGGGRSELVDGDIDMACERAAAIARHDGIRLVEDSLDVETCEGAVTIGLELVDSMPSFDAVLIALGGGALAAGVGHVIKVPAPRPASALGHRPSPVRTMTKASTRTQTTMRTVCRSWQVAVAELVDDTSSLRPHWCLDRGRCPSKRCPGPPDRHWGGHLARAVAALRHGAPRRACPSVEVRQ
ncbi:pyridoxal-phosphate dependent enzyme [Nonomuraea angiospora]|uniref:pyridoxal-phosphate dependent enzyme n=1 Tax=Nonomuraea angiospora TaxID=46172 RepID=UPI0033CA0547